MRDARLDAAKFGLIVLVVFGHLLELFKGGSPWFELTYRFVYMFHMPAFVFLSGMVSSDSLDARTGRRLLATVVIPLLVFQAVLPAWEAYLKGGEWRYSFVTPYWILWYLASLVAWRLLLPLLTGSGMPMLLSVLVCLGAGLVPDIGYAYSASRTATFLPFFVAGYLYARRQGLVLPSINPRVWIGAALMIGVWLVAKWSIGSPMPWLYGSVSYAAMGMEGAEGVMWRTLLLIVGGCGLVGFFCLVPKSELLAGLGRYSIAAFLLHAFLMKLALYKGWLAPLVKANPLYSLVLAMLVAILLAAGLCWIGRLLNPLFDYRWLWSGFEKQDRRAAV
ncbi:acyltransferase family protein [Stenotrophomonas sp. SY1]|uniref:acyltransferase family protein n=1 Tax=Stenotrophomonas sp. SY1 TaxID=477235 RepID=UPI001E5A97FA|nr:acyltransferase family protein [Stenotrophomonas sp. SY1]